MIKYILLGLLNYQPMTGYDLKQTLDHSVSHFWHAYHSQIYTTLRQMESDGLVVSQFIYAESQPDRRVYSLTDAGLIEFKTWLDQPLTEMSPIKEELLVRLFFSARRDKKSVLAELYLQRELHQKKWNEYRSLMAREFSEKSENTLPQFESDAVFWKMTLNMGLGYEEMYMKWLNQSIQELEAM
jgi:PadR family transcriptional regulator, regulatory protein AphA